MCWWCGTTNSAGLPHALTSSRSSSSSGTALKNRRSPLDIFTIDMRRRIGTPGTSPATVHKLSSSFSMGSCRVTIHGRGVFGMGSPSSLGRVGPASLAANDVVDFDHLGLADINAEGCQDRYQGLAEIHEVLVTVVHVGDAQGVFVAVAGVIEPPGWRAVACCAESPEDFCVFFVIHALWR